MIRDVTRVRQHSGEGSGSGSQFKVLEASLSLIYT